MVKYDYIQQIRRSQFILTYGPGTIIESRDGPRIIPAIKEGLNRELFSEEKFEEFEITDSRLRIAIKKLMNDENVRIFSIPTNASLGKSEMDFAYKTYPFPEWKICYGKTGGSPHTPVLYKGEKCPLCSNKMDNSSSVRFVAVCVDGHLDDVNWNYAVHQHKNCDHSCKPEYYFWKTNGSSLSDIVIECPVCHCNTNMGEIYNMNFKCTGRFPENDTPANPSIKSNCNKKMKVVQRQSSSLRIPYLLTLLTLPQYDNNISNILQRTPVYNVIKTIMNIPSFRTKEEDIISWINKSLKDAGIPEKDIRLIEDFIKKNHLEAFVERFNLLNDDTKEIVNFFYDEFEVLSDSTDNTTDNFKMGSPIKCSLNKYDINVDLDVYPVEMLRTITAQIGYRRVPYTPTDTSHIVPSYADLRGYKWYPGFESLGEGIFITFSDGKPPEFSNKIHNEWTATDDVRIQDPIYNPWSDISHKNKPLFVWLHTISHALIMAISLDAGYSSSSLRERIYVNGMGNNGGILIYTSLMGGDGSMGGLAGAVDADIFKKILDRAYDRIRVCSNDPLCADVRKTHDRVNGAACHSCLLISETSCEHRNRMLDRHIVIGD
ncbi:MAG: DrmB family protein [Thermoplasmata archaeon]